MNFSFCRVVCVHFAGVLCVHFPVVFCVHFPIVFCVHFPVCHLRAFPSLSSAWAFPLYSQNAFSNCHLRAYPHCLCVYLCFCQCVFSSVLLSINSNSSVQSTSLFLCPAQSQRSPCSANLQRQNSLCIQCNGTSRSRLLPSSEQSWGANSSH